MTRSFGMAALAAIVALPLAATGAAAQGSQTAPSTSPSSSSSSSTSNSSTEQQPMMGHGGAKHAFRDQAFIRQAAQGGMAEVDVGQLAVQKSSNPDVKTFAQKLIDDHTKANDQLKQIASQENVTLPAQPGREGRQLHTKLEKLDGAAFDRAFLQAQVRDHEKDIKQYQRAENQVQDPQLKQFAQTSLPILQQHLQMAKDLASSTSASGKSS